MNERMKAMAQALRNWNIQRINAAKVEKMFQGQADYNKSVKPR